MGASLSALYAALDFPSGNDSRTTGKQYRSVIWLTQLVKVSPLQPKLLTLWLRRWNFIARARLERELWDAFERREDLEAKLDSIRRKLDGGNAADKELDDLLRLEVWTTTLRQIRRIEENMRGKTPPPTD